ncbi:MAG TPA: acetyl-CoA hydrolase/transferase C-terminal domain-containing protein [Candidatus Binatia bacterium]|nr:acetyl-CoA hydrolase/transferase C-terminal domain-containing protein [Candidatus Binatia bacterium]
MTRRLTLEEAAGLVRPRDTVLCGFAAGQPVGILEALGARTDIEEVVVYTGLLIRPFTMLTRPGIRVVSGFFGPIERAARAAGAAVEYLPADFHGLERLALRMKPRVALAVTTPPDADGWLSFGVTAGASYRAFLEAAADPQRVALAEVNPRMPRVRGIAELGGNRVHRGAIDGWVEHETELVALPASAPSPEDLAIAGRVTALVEEGATLQFGIGAIPDEIARRLADGPLGDFGIHTEMVSDGVMQLHRAGKVTNRKGLHDGVSVGTFALGTAALYAWLAEDPVVRMLPVGAVNDPAVHRALRRFVSVNGALALDLAGQVAADHIGGRQYSGVGGHEAFVTGASEATGGKSVLCLRSTAMVAGRRVSTIVPHFAPGTTVTTPRHHVQWVVTEHGAVDLSVLGDRARIDALVSIAHPDFRDELRAGA